MVLLATTSAHSGYPRVLICDDLPAQSEPVCDETMRAFAQGLTYYGFDPAGRRNSAIAYRHPRGVYRGVPIAHAESGTERVAVVAIPTMERQVIPRKPRANRRRSAARC